MARNRAQILITAVDETRRAFRSIEGSLSRLRDQASRVGDTLRNIGGAIGVGLGLRELLDAADQYKGLQARLQLAVTSQEAFNRADRELFDIAQRNRAPLSETVTLYAKLAPSIRALGRMVASMAASVAASRAEAARGASLLARAGGLLRGALALLGGPIGLIVTGLGLLATAAFSARDKVVAFGGKTATIGQIVSAAWELVTEKIGAFVDALIGLVGINDKTWASLRETVIDGVAAIGRAVRSFVNGIIGAFNAVGKVVGITAAFLVRRFKRAFSDIAALARALGQDIAAAFEGDFSLRHLKAALRAGRDEMRGFGKALGDAVKESLGRDYVGETARAIAARIRNEQKRQRLFAQSQAKGTPSAEDNAARLKLAESQSEAELRILKEGLAQALRALDRTIGRHQQQDQNPPQNGLWLQGYRILQAQNHGAA